jgi:hypothetical protein
MIIKIERSGGLSGIPFSREINVNDLPSRYVATAKKIISSTKSSKIPLKPTSRGSADLFTYKILIKDGSDESITECNESNMQADLKSLIKYIERK